MSSRDKSQDQAAGNAQGGRDQGDGEQETRIAPYGAEVLDTIPGAREAFLRMLEAVPETGDDAAAQIVVQILGAETVEDLDKPWDAEGMREYDGQVLTVYTIRKLPSTYKKTLGVYLVCEVDQPHIGEKFILTTGSVSIVAQLVVANARGWLPLQVVPRQADERPDREGRPMHLELVRRSGRQRAQVVDGQVVQ